MDKRNKLQLYKDLEKKSYIDLYRMYYEHKRSYLQDNNKKSEKFMKIIQFIIDNKDIDKKEKDIIHKNYNSYPDYSDSDFNTELSKKAEFFHCKGLLNLIELEDKCFSKDFELGNHQNFLKNFMNKNTPYKSILIFHGVGVGKTCSAVTISNSFIDLYKKEDKKIICLVSKNIHANWMNTIYDPEKGDNQCNGENFQNIIRSMNQKANTSGRVKKLIKEYYEFYGYQQFSNKVKKLIKVKSLSSKNKTIHEIEKQVIKNYFSDRVLIIDEVHNLRDDALDNYSKDTVKFLDKVIRYSDNLRLIVMSATPMFNRATEIQWVLNLLLKNDKRPTISNKEIFDEDENLTEEGALLLKKKTRGYISYVRGENPVTFPIRLYPDNKGIDDPLCLTKYPEKDIYGEQYDSEIYRFKFLKMYYNQMESYQSDGYKGFIESLNHSSSISITERRFGIQISNIVYPSIDILSGNGNITKDNFQNNYGGKGLFQLVQNKKNMFSYRKDFIKSKGFIPLFDINNIGMVSSKIKNLLDGFQQKKPKGIIFIYSEFLPSGIIPLALALEHMGFEKYSKNLLDYPDWSPSSKGTKSEPIDYNWNPMSKKKGKQAKYIILSGNKSLSPNNDEEIKELVSNKNVHGENIKIVIGNVVAAEGLDLKNIREMHILDPWFHLSRIEQIIGRGIRFCSHIQLPKEERNVLVYLHVAGISEETESIDTYTYRKAEEKAIIIGQVENILKENAVDCYLNREINLINAKKLFPIDLVTSRGDSIKNHEVNDKEFSKICSYGECQYTCNCDTIREEDINYDTFTMENSKDLFKKIKKIILELYEIKNYYTMNELNEYIMEAIDTNTIVIYYSLYNIMDQKVTLWNKERESGYLINKNEYYLFQPHNIHEKSLPLYYRNTTVITDIQRYIPLGDNLFEEEGEEVKVYTYEQVIKDLTEMISNKELFQKDYSFNEYIRGFKENNYIDIQFDMLLYGEKLVLLKDIVKEYIENGKIVDKLRLQIFEHFKNNLIHKVNSEYSILGKNTKNTVGFFLMNTTKFHQKKKKGIQELEEIENDYSYFIYQNGDFYELSELGDGNLIRMNIKGNFLEIKDKVDILKTEAIWGYPFKMENGKYTFKLVDNKLNQPHKLPGRIVSQISKKNSLRDFIKRYFPDTYDILIKEDPDLEYQTKHFLYLLIEMIIRNKEKAKRKKHVFLPYDLVFLKFIE